MNIKDISGLKGITPTDAARSNATPAQKSGVKESTDRPQTAERLTLTAIGQYLASAADEPPPVDRARVNALRDALAAGNYEIDSERVAAKLLAVDRELV